MILGTARTSCSISKLYSCWIILHRALAPSGSCWERCEHRDKVTSRTQSDTEDVCAECTFPTVFFLAHCDAEDVTSCSFYQYGNAHNCVKTDVFTVMTGIAESTIRVNKLKAKFSVPGVLSVSLCNWSCGLLSVNKLNKFVPFVTPGNSRHMLNEDSAVLNEDRSVALPSRKLSHQQNYWTVELVTSRKLQYSKGTKTS